MDGIIALALAKKYADQVGQQVISAGFKVQVEQDRSILNGQGQEKILYLLPKASGSTGDGYDEFVYAQNSWEWIGKTDIDLSVYALKTEVGDLSNLPTTDKSSLVAAVSETFTNVSDGKALVASAITDKGVQTSSDATFAIMAQNIEDIENFTIPVDPDSQTPIVFGKDSGGFFISDTTSDKTDLAFGKDSNGIYVNEEEELE